MDSWFAFGLAVAGFLAAVPIAGFVYQSLGKRRDRRRFPPLGRMLSVRSRQFHVIEQGTGPTVLLESGIASSSLAWTTIQRQLAKEARVIAYDRAGLGWSAATPTKRTLDAVVEDLHSVLLASGAPMPYVLVGHSYGGLIVRAFAGRYPSLIAGMVLVDPLDTCEWNPLTETQRKRLNRGVMLSRRGALLARFGVVRFALVLLASGQRRLPQFISRWSSGRGASVPDRLVAEVRKLPPETWPMIRMHWSDEKCFRAMAEYLELLPSNCQLACDAGWPRGVPTIALTVPGVNPDFPAGVDHRVAARSGHWIQLDQPDLVLDVIREILAHSAAGARSST